MRALLIATLCVASLPARASDLPFPKLVEKARLELDAADQLASAACKEKLGEGLTRAHGVLVELKFDDDAAKFEGLLRDLSALAAPKPECSAGVMQHLESSKGWAAAAQSHAEPKVLLPVAAECARLIACSEALVPGSGASLMMTYGRSGQCWKSKQNADACVSACTKGLGNLSQTKGFGAAPACK
jgi:hypothetical protein